MASSAAPPQNGSSSQGSGTGGTAPALTLESVRDCLIRQEDTIIFSLIERARFPLNPRAYDPSYFSGGDGSLVEFYVRESEILQAKAGKFQNPEEVPFFPASLTPPDYSQVLYPAAASININKTIWNMYIENLLPLFTADGDDGNYASTAAADLACLQALSRRIHYGRFVAEVKFRDSPQDYSTAIRAQDRDALMKLLTFESIEEAVKKRVEKKATIFGHNVILDNKNELTYYIDDKSQGKISPAVLSRLYGEWIMPLTKLVQVEYLLHRLD